MAITQDTILGQDCAIQLQTASYTQASLVNWKEVRASIEKVTAEYNPATATYDGYVSVRGKCSDLVVQIIRGLYSTMEDLIQIFNDEAITSFTCTDFPSHATMTTNYGPLGVVKVEMAQTGEPGTAQITMRYGHATHGYTPV